MKKSLLTLIILIGFYLVTTGVSFAFFSSSIFKSSEEIVVSPEVAPAKPGESKLKILLTGPKESECPFNGAKFTKKEEELWSGRRPLLVMIENHVDSRPQSGLAKADIVYEAVAEGAITRFMGVFYCGTAAYTQEGEYDIGPVRSARTYFLDWASEYGDYPLYNHVGGANCSAAYDGGPCTTNYKAQALEQISRYGWLSKDSRSDLNQFALSYSVCRREPDRTGKTMATEHSMYCSTFALWDTAAKRGLTNINLNLKKQPVWNADFKRWLFKDDASSGTSVSPEFYFWKDYKDYKVKWVYDAQSNSYKRLNGEVAAQDFYYKEDLVAKNVVVQVVKETTSVDEHMHNLYQTLGQGKAFIFQDGKVILGSWSKNDRTSRTKFSDSAGKEVRFNRGQIWIEVIPSEKTLSY